MFVKLLKSLVGLALVLLVALPVAGALLAIEGAPRVGERPPPDAAAAARTRELATELRDLVSSGDVRGSLAVTEEGLNAALASAARVVPGLRGAARVGREAASVAVSLPMPGLEGRWLNLRAGLAGSEAGIEVTEARLGRLALPPALVVPAARLALDWVLGDGLGSAAIEGVRAVRLAPPRVEVAFVLDAADREALEQRAKAVMRARAGGIDANRVYVQLYWLDDAVQAGALPREGSVLPYLRHAVRRAGELAEGAPDAELRAALMALTLYCGDERVGPLIGVNLPQYMRGGRNGCAPTQFGGRDDLKRHFVVSAGLFAASTGEAALGVGELKELLDSNAGGSGFSFDDMAANLAGARFAAAFFDAPAAAWPAMLGAIGGEGDLLPPIEGLDSGMSAEEFAQGYGDLDDPAYAAVIAEIERRIDALPFFAALPIY